MSVALRTHWARVFSGAGINQDILDRWLDEDVDNKPLTDVMPFDPSKMQLRKKHIIHALRHSNNSTPGLDGIPFMAWRACVKFSAQILFDAAQAFFDLDIDTASGDDLALFNHSLLFFLQKKASGTLRTGEGYYEAANVRPLNVTNTDYRILCNAVRALVEPLVGFRVLGVQRGFIGCSSLLANSVDVDEAMAVNACTSNNGAAIFFFGFVAAFPSAEHSFLKAVCRKLGWQRWLINFIDILYPQNSCQIVLGGSRHTGFQILRGVRQGWPLSQLLFAVACDVLLRRVDINQICAGLHSQGICRRHRFGAPPHLDDCTHARGNSWRV